MLFVQRYSIDEGDYGQYLESVCKGHCLMIGRECRLELLCDCSRNSISITAHYNDIWIKINLKRGCKNFSSSSDFSF